MRQLHDLADQLGINQDTVLSEALRMYGNLLGVVDKTTAPKEKLERIIADPNKRIFFSEIMSLIAKHQNAMMEPEDLSSRGRSGGIERAKSLSPQERMEISRAANKAKLMYRLVVENGFVMSERSRDCRTFKKGTCTAEIYGATGRFYVRVENEPALSGDGPEELMKTITAL